MPTDRSTRSRESQQEPAGPQQGSRARDASSLPPQSARPGNPPTTCGAPAALVLPKRYNQDLIGLMLQDPFTLYCYWEVTANTLSCRARAASGGEVFVVRVHPENDDHFDVGVGGAVGSVYISLENGGGSYFVELGLRASDGGFHPILRSNTVLLPPVGASEVEDHRWQLVEELYQPAPHPVGPDGQTLPRSCVNSGSSYDLSSASLVRKKER